MAVEMGEYVVGAYLRLVEECDVVDYNVRPIASGREGQSEIDAVGLRFKDGTAFLCEVATHLDGLNYGSYDATVGRIREKFLRQQRYAKSYLRSFAHPIFMLWAPWVPMGTLTERLAKLNGLELVINGDYTSQIEQLESHARTTTKDFGNPFFRALQIVNHLRPR
mgnify:CR=1 FL=1